jgi:CRISPR/Cas system CMR-associated protein Cmr3 (group 5 of RAMP superfamily)
VAAVLALLGVVAFAVTREVSSTSRATTPVLSRPAAPARPAFTAAEAVYIRALWPIHGDVERSAVRLALGQIFYKNNDMDRIALKGRADQALATYRRSEARLRALEPPPSVQREHEAYLAASGLFEQSTVEILKMFADGRDDHLMAAYPLGQQATDKIRRWEASSGLTSFHLTD